MAISLKLASIKTPKREKTKQWLWFVGLYLGALTVLGGFSLIVHCFIPNA